MFNSVVLGNTPLGLSLMGGHAQYSLILIREKANVRHPLYHPVYKKNKGEKKIIESKETATMFSEVLLLGLEMRVRVRV